MKNLLIVVLLLIAKSAFSQNYQDYIKTDTDDVSGKSFTSMKSPISNNGTLIDIYVLSNNEIIFAINNKEAGCIEAGADIYILFEDSSRIIFHHNSSFNCKGDAVVYFGGIWGRNNEWNTLSTKKILKLRFTGHSSSPTVLLTKEEANNLMNAFKCLKKE